MGWEDLSNGSLLRKACEGGFDVFLTVDQNIRFQQNLLNHPIAIVVMVGRGITVEDLRPLVPKVEETLFTIRPGKLYEVSHP
ncbi:MAG: hypothetical protein ACKV2V_11275 [Blastocatellia bacterium]